ncbi:MAG: AAA family ATPase, partial [Muribaculaceae bacterium]|nr:AAA family ATPase [Muribaculaceae bacterium]
VILIRTSNAGAHFASQAKVGLVNTTSSGEAMMRQVKKTFKPEFINRLSGTVIFNEMSREMASLILDKKLNRLRKQLESKKVTLSLSTAAREYILTEGFTAEYGARELDRVISEKLKPLLMREILFGSLKKGGEANIVIKDNKITMS